MRGPIGYLNTLHRDELGREVRSMYERCDDQNKRLASQTFFTRIYLNEGGTLTAGTAAPFTTILDEDTNQ
ncbi:hypothetical protein GCM10027416_12930 [Okibacterium endophyticum]